MLKSKLVFTALFLGFAVFSSVPSAVAACNEGHESTGNQSRGGPNGRWELVCDQTTMAICCVSHPKKDPEIGD